MKRIKARGEEEKTITEAKKHLEKAMDLLLFFPEGSNYYSWVQGVYDDLKESNEQLFRIQFQLRYMTKKEEKDVN